MNDKQFQEEKEKQHNNKRVLSVQILLNCMVNAEYAKSFRHDGSPRQTKTDEYTATTSKRWHDNENDTKGV